MTHPVSQIDLRFDSFSVSFSVTYANVDIATSTSNTSSKQRKRLNVSADTNTYVVIWNRVRSKGRAYKQNKIVLYRFEWIETNVFDMQRPYHVGPPVPVRSLKLSDVGRG